MQRLVYILWFHLRVQTSCGSRFLCHYFPCCSTYVNKYRVNHGTFETNNTPDHLTSRKMVSFFISAGFVIVILSSELKVTARVYNKKDADDTSLYNSFFYFGEVSFGKSSNTVRGFSWNVANKIWCTSYFRRLRPSRKFASVAEWMHHIQSRTTSFTV